MTFDLFICVSGISKMRALYCQQYRDLQYPVLLPLDSYEFSMTIVVGANASISEQWVAKNTSPLNKV